jgi:hypothetical protein
MTDTVVRSRPGGGAAVVFALLAAAAVAAGVLAQTVHWLVFAVLPACLAAAAWLSRDPEVLFEVTEEGLSFELPERVFVRYEEIEGLTAQGQAKQSRFGMQVYHPDGVVRIPPGIDVSSRELYRHVLARLPRPTAGDPEAVPGAMRGFVEDQVERFGADKVFTYRARGFPPAASHGRQVAYSRAVAVTGLIWAAAGGALIAALNNPPGRDTSGGGWIAVGVLAFLFGLLFAFAFARQSTAGRPTNWRSACLIISPGGVAMSQGDLRGKMRWEELRDIQYPASATSFWGVTSAGASPGIRLVIAGGHFLIHDYYDRPLGMIHARLKAYWGGRDAN